MIPEAEPMRDVDAWAGYLTIGENYTGVNTLFTVPTLTPTEGITTSVSAWAGLQGDKHLVQAGIWSSIDPTNGKLTEETWWEITGPTDPGPTNMGLAVNPGDEIQVYVGSNAENDGFDGFMVANLTQGTSQTHYEYDPNNFAGDNSFASCVVERQGGIIANFGTLHMTGCTVHVNGGQGMAPIESVPSGGENMVGGDTPLVSTSPLTNGADFDLTWQNAGIGLL
jgi:Peptidase A4 family